MIEIAIPVYNGGRTIKRTLQSLKKVRCPIKIYNNGSTDNTIKIIEKYKKKNKNIEIFNFKCKSVAENIKRCLINSNSKYVMLLSSNDILKNNYIDIVKDDMNIGRADLILRNYDWFLNNKENVIRKKKIENHSGFLDFKKKKHCIIFLDKADQLSGLIFKTSSVRPLIKKIVNKPFIEILSLCMYFFKKKVLYKNNYFISCDSFGGGSAEKWAYEHSPIKSFYNIIPNNLKKKDEIRYFLSQKYVSLIQIRYHGGLKNSLIEIFHFMKINPKLILNFKFVLISLFVIFFPKKLILQIKNKFKHISSKYFDY